MDIGAVAESDLDALFDLRDRAFGPHPSSLEMRTRFARRAIGEGRVLGCYDGGALVASGRFHDMAQWWHGRALPMAGVASVYVAPEQRGRGVGRRLMTGLLEHIAGRGYPLSVLYPATAPPYHSVGYEHAGAQHVVTLRTEALRTLARGGDPVRLRRAASADAAEVVATMARANEAGRVCGPIRWSEYDVAAALEDPETFGYLAADGYLGYGFNGDNSELHVEHLVASSTATLRTLGALVGSGSSVADTVRACLAPHDPLLWLLRDRTAEDVRRVPWMLRVVDAPAAIAGRGFPAGVSVTAPLAIEDALRPGNTGTWRLTVADGRGRLDRTGDAADAAARGDVPRLSARGLAAMYAGIPMDTLRGSGLAAGGTGVSHDGAYDGAHDGALDAAFAATPYMLDYF